MKKFCLFSLVCLLLGCTANKSEESENKSVFVNLKDSTNLVPVEEFLDTTYFDFIKLADTNVPVGEISKVQITADKIILFSEQQNTIFVFSNNGECVLILNKLGRAKNEYLEITDFCYSEGSLYIADKFNMRVLKYDMKGNLLKSVDYSRYWANKLFVYDSCIYLVNEGSETEEGNFQIFKLDEDGKCLDKYLPFTKEYGQSSQLCYVEDNGKIIYGQKPDNVIYEIDKSGIKKMFSLDFGEYTMPEEYWVMDDLEMMKEHLNDKYSHGLKKFYSTDKYYIFYIDDMKWNTRVAIYDKEKEKVIRICSGLDFNTSNFYSQQLNTIVANNCLYSILDAAYAKFLPSYLRDTHPETTSKKYLEKLDAISNSLTDSSNPVIVKYKFL